MPARQSAEVTRALRLVANGSTAYAAAKKTGIALSTIYRALKRQRAGVAFARYAMRLASAKGDLMQAEVNAKLTETANPDK